VVTETKSTRKSIPVAVAAIVVLLAVGGAAFWYLDHQAGRQPDQGPALSAEARQYVHNLKLSDVEIKAKESYIKQTVVEIVGKIANTGDRPLQSVELNCVFYDPYGQVVLRERVAIVRGRSGGLKPGETKSFRLPFDNIPESWNQGLPQLVIAQVIFG
jgi:hypothetical protein